MGFVTLLREVLTENELNRWGWRVPFLSSVILGFVGLYLRYNLHESEEFMRVKNRGLTTSKLTHCLLSFSPSPLCFVCFCFCFK